MYRVDPGAPVDGTSKVAISISGNLAPTWPKVKETTLITGDSYDLQFGLVDDLGNEVDSASLKGTGRFSAQLVAADGKVTDIGSLDRIQDLDDPTFPPLSLAGVPVGRAELKMTLELTTAKYGKFEGTKLNPQIVDLPVTILPAPGMPQLGPLIDFGTVEGTENLSAAAELPITGPGCVWLPAGTAAEVYAGPDGVVPTISSSSNSDGSCVRTAEGQTGSITFQLASEQAGNGTLAGNLPVTVAPLDEPDRATVVPGPVHRRSAAAPANRARDRRVRRGAHHRPRLAPAAADPDQAADRDDPRTGLAGPRHPRHRAGRPGAARRRTPGAARHRLPGPRPAQVRRLPHRRGSGSHARDAYRLVTVRRRLCRGADARSGWPVLGTSQALRPAPVRPAAARGAQHLVRQPRPGRSARFRNRCPAGGHSTPRGERRQRLVDDVQARLPGLMPLLSHEWRRASSDGTFPAGGAATSGRRGLRFRLCRHPDGPGRRPATGRAPIRHPATPDATARPPTPPANGTSGPRGSPRRSGHSTRASTTRTEARTATNSLHSIFPARRFRRHREGRTPMRRFLVVGCGGSGGKTLAYLMDQLRSDLSKDGVTELPAGWQFVFVDVPSGVDDGPEGLGSVVAAGRHLRRDGPEGWLLPRSRPDRVPEAPRRAGLRRHRHLGAAAAGEVTTPDQRRRRAVPGDRPDDLAGPGR